MQDKDSSFTIPLKSQGEEVQTINFTSKENIITIGSKYQPTKFSVAFASDGTFIYIDNTNHEYDHLKKHTAKTDENYIMLKLKNVFMDQKSNIKFTTDCEDECNIKTIEISPKQILITNKDGSENLIDSNNLDITLPKNIFSLIAKEKIKAKNLPSQMFDICSKLNDNAVLSLVVSHKNKQIKFIKATDEKNAESQFYIVSGTKLVKFSGKNIFVHEKKNDNFIGIVLNSKQKKSSRALGLFKIDDENYKNITEFIGNENQIKLTDEELKKQIIKPTSPQKEKSLVKNAKIKKQEETMFNFFENNKNVNDEMEKKQEVLSEEKENKKQEFLSEEKENNIIKKTDDTDINSNGAQAQVTDIDKEKLDEKAITIEENLKNPEEKTVDNEVVKQIIQDKKQPEQIKSGDDKKESKKEGGEEITVDLSNITKIFAISLFLFGFFTGIGGLLTSIIAMGIGSAGWTTKGISKVGYKSKSNKGMFFNFGKKGNLKDEKSAVDEKIKNNEISLSDGSKIKQSLSKLENSNGIISKIKTEMDKKLSDINKQVEKYSFALEKIKAGNLHGDKILKINYKLKQLKEKKQQLESENQKFETKINNIEKHLFDTINATNRYMELKGQEAELTENIEEKLAKIENTINESNQIIRDSEEMSLQLEGNEIDEKTKAELKQKMSKNVNLIDKIKQEKEFLLSQKQQKDMIEEEVKELLRYVDKENFEEIISSVLKETQLSMKNFNELAGKKIAKYKDRIFE